MPPRWRPARPPSSWRLGALGVGAGDEVLIPTYVCDALHHAVRRAGATPVLVDADPATHSLSAKDALAAARDARAP